MGHQLVQNRWCYPWQIPWIVPKHQPSPKHLSLQVTPDIIDNAIPGQRCVFLVTVTDKGLGMKLGKAVNISATASNATVIVDPPAITPGKVAEVVVIPDDINGNGDEPPDPPRLEILEEEPIIDDEPIIPGDGDETETITVTIMGERKWFNTTQTVTLEVREGEDHLASIASEMRDRFIPWLAENYPELGIDEETEWTGTIVRPRILVVMYYLFFSEEWEMGVRWHVMIPPYDWAEIYLRNRRTEISPSLAFKIPSLDAQDEPEVVDPPESVWR